MALCMQVNKLRKISERFLPRRDGTDQAFEPLRDELDSKMSLAVSSSLRSHRCMMPVRCRIVGNREMNGVESSGDL